LTVSILLIAADNRPIKTTTIEHIHQHYQNIENALEWLAKDDRLEHREESHGQSGSHSIFRPLTPPKDKSEHKSLIKRLKLPMGVAQSFEEDAAKQQVEQSSFISMSRTDQGMPVLSCKGPIFQSITFHLL
jgi:hypothetical protein